ncbi:hypothetical protein H0484_14890 [Pusillimonas sp. CC-YST705]|uniref:Uncharacterized protein n=1 Tax=Mesopusillimonas faecipullorum TaxID=2755040 RepID=A0ABS8CG62_9BURK|nr:hypothetical protein [Mesopusillimonas faecipullorum]MCB5365022.1 hypothetical protein [Mesopusillimonas faecipullorum]
MTRSLLNGQALIEEPRSPLFGRRGASAYGPITDRRDGTGLTRDQVRNDPLVWLQLVAEPASGLTLMLVEFEQSPKFGAKE